jgi:hypothetical protein
LTEVAAAFDRSFALSYVQPGGSGLHLHVSQLLQAAATTSPKARASASAVDCACAVPLLTALPIPREQALDQDAAVVLMKACAYCWLVSATRTALHPLLAAIQAQPVDCATDSAEISAFMQPLAQAMVNDFLLGLSMDTSVAGVISIPLMVLAVICTKADAHALAKLVMVARGSPPEQSPLTAFPTASAHATDAWFVKCRVLLLCATTRPAPFAEYALLLAQTDTRASCGLEKASAQEQQQHRQQG